MSESDPVTAQTATGHVAGASCCGATNPPCALQPGAVYGAGGAGCDQCGHSKGCHAQPQSSWVEPKKHIIRADRRTARDATTADYLIPTITRTH